MNIEKSEIIDILQGFNPWWQGNAPHTPTFRRTAYAECREFLCHPTLKRAVLLSGPRRVGKTTILQQLAQGLIAEGRAPSAVCFLSLDHPILKLAGLPAVLRTYHEIVSSQDKNVFLLLDEAQYAQDWELHLKQLIDHHPEYRILVTGSASVVHRQGISESGAGRWIRVPIHTLSFREFLHIRGEAPQGVPEMLGPARCLDLPLPERRDLAQIFHKTLPLFRRFLLVGGFPETALQPDLALCQRLLREDVVERVLKRDMTALFGVRNVDHLERLFVYICMHSGGVFSTHDASRNLGVHVTTISNHLEALEQANLIYRLWPTLTTGKKLLKTQSKIYLADAALRNAVLLRGEAVLDNATEMGGIVETAILRHLLAAYHRDNPRITYWRDTRTKREVDFILETPAYQIPIEVKYQGNALLAADEGMWAFVEQVHPAWGVWVTRDDTDFDTVDIAHAAGARTQILRIPAHIFTYLTGPSTAHL